MIHYVRSPRFVLKAELAHRDAYKSKVISIVARSLTETVIKREDICGFINIAANLQTNSHSAC